ncbi:hypothetical protein KQI76_06995 [Amphibacillus sp. MSJ-3]|uniref:hypothetical protein n=1 Tax=Amphibacillus sp. MSJ-3 TaxID=2841505 RepID=UPI001C0EFEBD|nr:hypothetical protein [Amphibacillus sp. MSJ-3]MBU5594908.1 hypothetical protein [Amphibacillus sp. MSJ-3]
MPIYIPDEWVINQENKENIYEILAKYYHTDLMYEGNQDNADKAKKELTEIGETIIIEKLEDGTIIVN